MALADLYTHDVSTKRISNVADNYGGNTSTYVANLTSYECRIYSPTGEMTIEDIGKITGTVFKAIGENLDVLEEDKLIDGTDEYIVKRIYKVYDKDSVQHLELILDKIK